MTSCPPVGTATPSSCRGPTSSSRVTACWTWPSITSPRIRPWPRSSRDGSSVRSDSPGATRTEGTGIARPFTDFAVRSWGDPRTRVGARQAARQARRLPHEGRARRRPVRRQGAEPAQPRPLVLAEAGPRRRDPPDPERHRPGGRRRGDADRLGVGGAAPRSEPDQALPAAVQRPAQGRQELPVHQGDPRRRLPAGRADAQAGQRRQPLLRARTRRPRASTSR